MKSVHIITCHIKLTTSPKAMSVIQMAVPRFINLSIYHTYRLNLIDMTYVSVISEQ